MLQLEEMAINAAVHWGCPSRHGFWFWSQGRCGQEWKRTLWVWQCV